MAANASSAESPADDISLPADHGYVLLRIIINERFEIDKRDRLIFKNVDTGDSFSIRIKTPYTAGVNAWLSLTSATKGHYFCEQFVPDYSMPGPCPGQIRIRRDALSADDIFEVKPGVVNYAGDWDLTSYLPATKGNEKISITFDMATIERAKAHFPEHLEKYKISISYKGRKAIPLDALAELLKKYSRSDEE
jgi:hypothetical protein